MFVHGLAALDDDALETRKEYASGHDELALPPTMLMVQALVGIDWPQNPQG
jgi:hypothetical protein